MCKLFWTLVLCVGLTCSEDVKKSEEGGEKEERLGLLASSLGVPPVPGYKPEAGLQGGGGIITGQALIGANGFQGPVGGGGFQGGNVGKFDTEPVPSLGGSGGQFPLGGNGGFQGANNGPCQCVPIHQCGTANGGGGPYPVPGGEDKLPVIGDPHGDPGYPPEEDQLGTNPIKDGAGVIDVRIVNRPSGQGSVQCSDGQIFCCGKNNIGSGENPVSDHFPEGGYTGCGKQHLLNVPGWVPEYGQAKFGAHPWMAVILGKGNNYIGAGALINSHYVLTAAHKVQSWKPGTYMKVRLGEWNAKDDDEPYKNVEIEVQHINIHPQFNPENLYNDVALIKLAKPIDVNAFPHIRAACMPTQYSNFLGKRCWVAGFGKDAFGNGKHSFIMKEVDVPVVESNTCETLLKATRLGKYFELNKHSFMCAGGEDGKDSCTGDGGSSLMCETNGVWHVAGLVAWGIGCADYAVPGVYVNVQNYLGWIENNIQY